jgi:hypothetical protein
VFRLLEGCTVVDLSRGILRRAGEPFPTPLGTLDALHLATALAWREGTGDPLVMATHDRELGLAAAAVGFQVVGAPREKVIFTDDLIDPAADPGEWDALSPD